MREVLFSKTKSLEEHNAMKEKLNQQGIAFREEISYGSGIKEMIFNFLVFRRASSGLGRSPENKSYCIWTKSDK